MGSVLLFILCANLVLLTIVYLSLPPKNGWLFIALCIFFPAFSLTTYINIGQAWLPDNPLHARKIAGGSSSNDSTTTTQNNSDKIALSKEAQQAFAALTPAERSARIRAMVDSMAERLYKNGGKPKEWLRLARAQSTLGGKAQAREALEKAERQYPSLKQEKSWIAASIATLLASPLDDNDKARIKKQLKQAKKTMDDNDMKILEKKLIPLLK